MRGEVSPDETLLAVFSSLNQVALIRRKLYRDGIYVEMTRSPQCLSFTGCSFALRCSPEQLIMVSQACSTAKIPLGGIFVETVVDGRPQYRPVADPGVNS